MIIVNTMQLSWRVINHRSGSCVMGFLQLTVFTRNKITPPRHNPHEADTKENTWQMPGDSGQWKEHRTFTICLPSILVPSCSVTLELLVGVGSSFILCELCVAAVNLLSLQFSSHNNRLPFYYILLFFFVSWCLCDNLYILFPHYSLFSFTVLGASFR